MRRNGLTVALARFAGRALTAGRALAAAPVLAAGLALIAGPGPGAGSANMSGRALAADAATAGPAVSGDAASARPVTVVDFSRAKDISAGDAILAWFAKQSPAWSIQLGTPSFFSVKGGALHLVAKKGPLASSWNPANLAKREDKVVLRITPPQFRVPVSAGSRLQVDMAPLKLPGRGADLTDSAKNDACFYLLVSFDGPRHSFHGSKLPDTVAYVWADGAWRSGAAVGRDPDYDLFMRYIALGRGPDRLGDVRTFTRDLAVDFHKAFPERGAALPPVVEVGLLIDSNTVGTEAESLLRAVRILP
jgi:hypothetical protein